MLTCYIDMLTRYDMFTCGGSSGTNIVAGQILCAVGLLCCLGVRSCLGVQLCTGYYSGFCGFSGRCNSRADKLYVSYEIYTIATERDFATNTGLCILAQAPEKL